VPQGHSIPTRIGHIYANTYMRTAVSLYTHMNTYTHLGIRIRNYLENAATRAAASAKGSTAAGSLSAPRPSHEDRRAFEVVSFVPWRAVGHLGIHIVVAN